MNYQGIDAIVGTYQPNFVYAVDTTQRMRTGFMVTAIDNYWGPGEFIYGKATATVPSGSICSMNSVLTNGILEMQMTAVATGVANGGNSLCVAMSNFTVGQFGWFCIGGLVPMATTTSIANGVKIGLSQTTAGRADTFATTFGVLNAKSILAATTTVVKAGCSGVSGASTIQVPNSEGWFIGCVLTGTGVGASALVTNVSPDGRVVTVSVANSAAVTGSVTATYTNFIVAHINRPTATLITA
jgi:predicted RecA/RadA family phage recombinase